MIRQPPPADKREAFSRTRDPGLRREIVESHLELATNMAGRFARRHPPPEDLVQVSSVALLKAVDRFDPDRGVDFVTYASHTIRGELKHYLRDAGWTVRPPRRVQELHLNLGPAISRLSQVRGRSPSLAELAEELEVTEGEVGEALQAAGARQSDNLEGPLGETETTDLAERLEDDDRLSDQLEARCVVHPGIGLLPEREQTILYLRFFEEKTQSEIAIHFGMSQNHVSRLLRQSLAQLRSRWEIDNID